MTLISARERADPHARPLESKLYLALSDSDEMTWKSSVYSGLVVSTLGRINRTRVVPSEGIGPGTAPAVDAMVISAGRAGPDVRSVVGCAESKLDLIEGRKTRVKRLPVVWNVCWEIPARLREGICSEVSVRLREGHPFEELEVAHDLVDQLVRELEEE